MRARPWPERAKQSSAAVDFLLAAFLIFF